MFKLFMVKDDYVNFCRKYDPKVQSNKEDSRKFIKKYLGIVFEINNMKYYVPLSSYKPEKHDNMSNKIDFVRIEDEKHKYAVLNLNNMIPVPDNAIIDFNINILSTNTEEERKYRDLLRNEWRICRAKRDRIIKNASKIYNMVLNNKPINIVNRCCNYKLLEKLSIQYCAEREVAGTDLEN